MDKVQKPSNSECYTPLPEALSFWFTVIDNYSSFIILVSAYAFLDRLYGLVVRVLGYRSGGPSSIPGTTRKKSSWSGTGSTQPREYN
jgi:hypothetical protein